mmetsp:Transcript_18217/g.29622  ORF Transcript_18217/g.29622 Transcript_18217/m.29622 type:complete len:86 (+) Transcript_18217:980-1237(+)
MLYVDPGTWHPSSRLLQYELVTQPAYHRRMTSFGSPDDGAYLPLVETSARLHGLYRQNVVPELKRESRSIKCGGMFDWVQVGQHT